MTDQAPNRSGWKRRVLVAFAVAALYMLSMAPMYRLWFALRQSGVPGPWDRVELIDGFYRPARFVSVAAPPVTSFMRWYWKLFFSEQPALVARTH